MRRSRPASGFELGQPIGIADELAAPPAPGRSGRRTTATRAAAPRSSAAVSVRRRGTARIRSVHSVSIALALLARIQLELGVRRAPRARRGSRRRAPAPSSAAPPTGATPPTSPASAARANRSAPARSAAPSALASSRARSASPSDSRAHASAVLRVDPVATELAGDLVDRGRVEADELAARADRRQHLDEPVGEQDQVHERGGLLERLQHPVGGLVAELVDALDHEHAPAATRTASCWPPRSPDRRCR